MEEHLLTREKTFYKETALVLEWSDKERDRIMADYYAKNPNIRKYGRADPMPEELRQLIKETERRLKIVAEKYPDVYAEIKKRNQEKQN